MKKIVKFLIALIIFFALLCGVIFFVVYSGIFGILNTFNITGVNYDNSADEYTISFDKVAAAVKYDVVIKDVNDVVVFDDEIKTNKLVSKFDSIYDGVKYTVEVTAYNKKGESRVSNNTYDFVKDDSVKFSDTNVINLNNEDILLYFTGDVESKNFMLEGIMTVINDDGTEGDKKTIYSENINSDTVEISNEVFKDKKVTITFNIYRGKDLIDTLVTYNNVNPLSKVEISEPSDGSTVEYSDVLLKYSVPNVNCDEYDITIYDSKNKLVGVTSTDKKEILLDKDLFNPGESYKITVTGKYDIYDVTSEINITMDNHGLSPVYIDSDFSHLQSGDTIELKSNDSDVSILYTLDGSSPIESGIEYNGPIIITEDTELSVYSRNKNTSSVVSTYDIKIADKNDITVYLSRSNQLYNIGANNYTNEREQINDLYDLIKTKLNDKGVNVLTNDYLTDYSKWNVEARNADLKIALQTESSYDHSKSGITTWISNLSSSTYGLANRLNSDISSIYSGNNYGVRCSHDITGSETSSEIPSITLELGYHDNESDADWFVNNKEGIADKIANSILEYYGL